MADGKRLRNQTTERGAVDVCFLQAEPFDQRRCIVAHVFERVGLAGIARVAGIALIVSDDREALFKLGGQRRKHRMVGFRAMHQHNWRSGTGSCVGNGCAIGLQPTHGASSRRRASIAAALAVLCPWLIQGTASHRNSARSFWLAGPIAPPSVPQLAVPGAPSNETCDLRTLSNSPLMRWTAPHKASRCRRVIVDDESPERAVHDKNYHHRARPCKEGVSGPRRGC